jgi:hypothetical protein
MFQTVLWIRIWWIHNYLAFWIRIRNLYIMNPGLDPVPDVDPATYFHLLFYNFQLLTTDSMYLTTSFFNGHKYTGRIWIRPEPSLTCLLDRIRNSGYGSAGPDRKDFYVSTALVLNITTGIFVKETRRQGGRSARLCASSCNCFYFFLNKWS